MPNTSKRLRVHLDHSKNNPPTAQVIVIGDETNFMRALKDDHYALNAKKRISKQVPIHDCNENCLPGLPDGCNLKSIANPFMIPMIMFQFTRVMLKLPPGSYCAICEYHEPAEGCPERHLVYVTPCGKILWCPEHVARYLVITKCTEKHNMLLSVDLFTFSEYFNLQQRQIKVREYIADISNGLEDVPVSWVNTNDRTMAKPNYRYINHRKIDICLDVNPGQQSEFRSCCSCEDNCESSECECKKLTRTENCGKSGYIHRRLYKPHKFGIFECYSGCPCNITCSNRVSQAGMYCRLQMFRSGRKGCGLRAQHFIPKGQYIAIYNGRLTESSQMDRSNEFKMTYMADLDYIEIADQASDTSITNLGRADLFGDDAKKFVVDGCVEGNLARSFNHSCTPNLYVQSIFRETHDMRWHEVALFALRDIHPFEELVWNYSYHMGGDNKRTIYCLCGCINCNIRLL